MTVKDLLDSKGKRMLTEIYVTTEEEAAAAESAGVDLLSVEERFLTPALRAACPTCFIIAGLQYGAHCSAVEYIRAGFNARALGADACYSASSPEIINAMFKEGIPVVGHVGLVPSRATWTGGFRAVGKTAESAKAVYDQTMRLQEAGAIGIELEVVPDQIATVIAQRTTMFVISMGAGSGGDAQYLFACDILGSHTGHYPRHAKRYRDFAAEYARLQDERVAAFSEFVADVHSGSYPEARHVVDADRAELQRFLAMLEDDSHAPA
jgi:3-methyl-2-oxobutanoate hydroxymethyltransferase